MATKFIRVHGRVVPIKDKSPLAKAVGARGAGALRGASEFAKVGAQVGGVLGAVGGAVNTAVRASHRGVRAPKVFATSALGAVVQGIIGAGATATAWAPTGGIIGAIAPNLLRPMGKKKK